MKTAKKVLIIILSMFLMSLISIPAFAEEAHTQPEERIKCPACLQEYMGYENEECPYCGYLTYHCPKCMNDVGVTDNVCSDCGFDLANGRQCLYCGFVAKDGELTCPNCGNETVNTKEYHSTISVRTCKACHKNTYGSIDKMFCVHCGESLKNAEMQIAHYSPDGITDINKDSDNPQQIKNLQGTAIVVCIAVILAVTGITFLVIGSADKKVNRKNSV